MWCFRAGELCDGGGPGLLSLSLYGLCGHTTTLKTKKEVKAGQLYERGGDMGSPSIIVPMVCVDVKQLKTRKSELGNCMKEEVIWAPRP